MRALVFLAAAVVGEPGDPNGGDRLRTIRCRQSLLDALRAIEDRFDRKRHECRHAPRNVDLDLLLYDDLVVNEDGLELPRGDIIRYAFVLCPLAEIAGDMRHPVNRKRFADLWHTFDKTGQKLWPVDTPFVSLNHTGDHSDV